MSVGMPVAQRNSKPSRAAARLSSIVALSKMPRAPLAPSIAFCLFRILRSAGSTNTSSSNPIVRSARAAAPTLPGWRVCTRTNLVFVPSELRVLGRDGKRPSPSRPSVESRGGASSAALRRRRRSARRGARASYRWPRAARAARPGRTASGRRPPEHQLHLGQALEVAAAAGRSDH